MIGILILIIVIFAIRQHRRSRALRSSDYTWARDEVRCASGWAEKFATEFPHRLATSIQRQAERSGSDFERRMADKFERQAARFETKMRRKFDKQTRRWSSHTDNLIGDPADPAGSKREDAAAREGAQAAADATKAYERARKRAAAEAGFYVHLMWYGVVIGFLFFINLMTTSFQWWVFPAIGWGFGVASHFVAVFGWRWVHERVFEPAIQREVEREVTKEKEVLRTEKQASLDELTATFAHEIRNPIAAAKSLVQQMGEDPTASENVEYAKVAIDELARVERSVSHLLKYAKEEDYHFDNVNLAAVVDAAITQMRGKLESKNVTVSRNYIGGPMVRADADKLRQVFTNVIDNAIDAMESNPGERRLEIGIHTLRPGAATVVLRDNGCGIPEDKLNKIFNPFYTTKANGTGLGMGIAKKVIDAHNGQIELHSQAGVGTQLQIAVPIAGAIRQTEAGQSTATDLNGAGSDGPQAPQGADDSGPELH